MNRIIISALVLILIDNLNVVGEYQQSRIRHLVIFGDSYSDTGNAYRLTNHTWPIVPPYYKGRFCNGPNWVDRMQSYSRLNYAYGSATTDNALVQGYTKLDTIPVPGVRQQIAQYQAEYSSKGINFRRTLFIIWAGGNDFIFNQTLTPQVIINSLADGIKDLIALGARNILLFNQPPIQAFPYIQAFGQNAYFTALTNITNIIVANTVATLQASNTKLSIKVFNIYKVIKRVLANASSIHFENTMDNCWNIFNITTIAQMCSHPSKYVFLDNYHFTSPVHQLIAEQLQKFLSSEY